MSDSFIHSFTFNSRLKAHAVEYNGKKHINSKKLIITTECCAIV